MAKLPQKVESKSLINNPKTMYFLSASSGCASLIFFTYEMMLYNIMAVTMLPIMLAAWLYGRNLSQQEQQLASEAEFDKFLLKFARKHRGTVFISHLVSECDITIEEAEYHLDRLVLKGYARHDIDMESGINQYIFPEFQSGHLQEIHIQERLHDLSQKSYETQPRSFSNELDIGGAYFTNKKRMTAGFLALIPFLGGIGIHKFYLGQTGKGILYLIFSWTYIPTLIGIYEGIIMLTQSDEEFAKKQGLKLKAGSRVYLPPGK